MAKKTENKQPETAVPIRFGKNKILGMKRFANRVDLLRVLLKSEEIYTLEAVETAIENFMKGAVK